MTKGNNNNNKKNVYRNMPVVLFGKIFSTNMQTEKKMKMKMEKFL